LFYILTLLTDFPPILPHPIAYYFCHPIFSLLSSVNICIPHSLSLLSVHTLQFLCLSPPTLPSSSILFLFSDPLFLLSHLLLPISSIYRAGEAPTTLTQNLTSANDSFMAALEISKPTEALLGSAVTWLKTHSHLNNSAISSTAFGSYPSPAEYVRSLVGT
jgi:hypothetical protein